MNRILETQKSLEKRFRGFLYSLDPERTVTLRELLTNSGQARERLQSPWLQKDILEEGLQSVEQYFNKQERKGAIEGYSGLPLIFLQRPDTVEDQKEFQTRTEDEFFRTRYAQYDPQYLYLHTQTNFFPKLLGTWRARKRHIQTLGSFTSLGQNSWRKKPCISGYYLPDFPDILNVCPQVATEYMLRVLIHDLGHGFFPYVASGDESLHNIRMIYARNKQKQTREDPWEDCVASECTDPYFFLEAKRYVESVEEIPLAVKEIMLPKFKSWYLSSKHTARWKRIWGIEQDMRLEEKRVCVQRTIEARLD